MKYSEEDIERAYVAECANNELRSFMIENPKKK